MDLFSSSQGIAQKKNQTTPLAQRLRPTCFEDILGQDHLIGPEGILFQMVAQKNFHSFILWGPPGTGKTTIARVFAMECGLEFHSFSAVLSNLKEVKDQMLKAKEQHHITGKPTVIFMDEIHRFNKLQQDAFLPFVESGDLVLIGATTENPSFEIRNALLSRLRVYTVKELSSDNIVSVLDRALKDDQVLIKKNIRLEDKAKNYIAQQSMGDARAALTLLEYCSSSSPQNAVIDQTKVSKVLQKNPLYYDQHGDQHYDIISALHKSLRNSDENAALYWMARMLEGGEDPLYVVRRLIRFASEDVGLADPHALVLAIACQQTVHFLGMPEGKLALAQLTVYLAQAPKSNAIYRAYQSVQADLDRGEIHPVPLAIRNAPTSLMKQLDYGKNYQYAHDHPDHTTSLQCLPQALKDREYYQPSEEGFERVAKERLNVWKEKRKKLRDSEEKASEKNP